MNLHQRWSVLSLATIALVGGSWAAGCAGGSDTTDFTPSSSNGSGGQGGTTSGTGGQGGQGATTSSGTGGSASPCEVDCSQIQAPVCQVAQCNVQSGQCEVVADADGTTCDDGVFCTVDDACLSGVCEGGPANECGITAPQCTEVVCDEQSQTCTTSPAQDGDPCQDPNDLCIAGATCNNGLCTGGTPEDCFFSPVPDDCHIAECNPQNGQCEPVVGNEGGPCADPNDLCTVAKTCANGLCQGGSPMNCSHLTVGCNMGVCDTNTGLCVTQSVGNGQLCDDLDPCTTGETCTNGNCGGGTAVQVCQAGDYCCPSNCNETNDLDCASCDWNPSSFPISYSPSSSVGDMAFDQTCNLYWSNDNGDVFKAQHNTNQAQLLHSFSSYARGLAFNPNDNMLYVGSGNTIYRMSTSGANPTALTGTTISTYYNGMEVAPSGWGAYGGHIIVAHSSGTIYAVNPAGGAPVSLASLNDNANDVVFDYSTGTAYVSYYQSNGVFTLSPTGQLTPFATGLSCDADGLAIDEGQTLFVSCGGTDTLYRLTIPGGVPTVIGTASLSGGWAPAGLLFDGLDNLLVMEDGASIEVYTP